MLKILFAGGFAVAFFAALIQLEPPDETPIGAGPVAAPLSTAPETESAAPGTDDLSTAGNGEAAPSQVQGTVTGPAQGGTSGPISSQSNQNSEITIDPSLELVADDAETLLSNEGSRVCASIETAIEAVRTNDWPTFDELMYAATPLASAAQEPEISQLSSELFALTTNPDPAPDLNRMFNVCVAEGHQV